MALRHVEYEAVTSALVESATTFDWMLQDQSMATSFNVVMFDCIEH